MGTDTGGTGGTRPSPAQKSEGDVPQKSRFLQIFLKSLPNFLYCSIFSKQSDQNPRRKQNLGVSGFDGTESVPQSKLRGGAPGSNFKKLPLSSVVTKTMASGY